MPACGAHSRTSLAAGHQVAVDVRELVPPGSIERDLAGDPRLHGQHVERGRAAGAAADDGQVADQELAYVGADAGVGSTP